MFCCPACLPTRRGFVAAAVGTAAAAAALPAQAAAAPGERWIDAHCHVFNVHDLPAYDFILRTRLTMPPLVRPPAALLLRVLIAGLDRDAPTAEGEARLLAAGGTPARLNLLGRDAPRMPVLDRLRAIAGDAPLPAGRDPDTARPAPPVGGAALVAEVLRETAPGRPADAPVTEAELRDLAGRLEAEVEPRFFGLFGSFVDWANGMSRSRFTMAGALVGQFPAGADVLLVSSMVDYSRWLGIEAGSSADPWRNVEHQLAALRQVAIRYARPDKVRATAGLLNFQPFDPWRFIEDRLAGRPDALRLIEREAEAGLVAGVKVYPPMGFRPSGNTIGLGPGDFPEPLRELARRHPQGSPDGHPGGLLDAAMEALFGLCARRGIPIMAHCGDTNEAAKGYAARSAPEWWAPVLRRHPGLRLNLGHFGGVWALGDRSADGDTARAWARQIAELMSPANHLHADLSFASQILDGGAAAEASMRVLEELIARHPILRQRLLYGSDWVMVGKEPKGDDYARAQRAFIARLFPGPAAEDYRWRNALRFLGLGAGEPARARVARFLDPLNPALLARFA